MAQPAPQTDSDGPPRVRLAQRPPNVTPEQWEERIRQAQLGLVRVLLRERARQIAAGLIPGDDEPDV